MLPERLAQLTFNATAWKAINNNYSDNHLVSMIIISNEYFLNQVPRPQAGASLVS